MKWKYRLPERGIDVSQNHKKYGDSFDIVDRITECMCIKFTCFSINFLPRSSYLEILDSRFYIGTQVTQQQTQHTKKYAAHHSLSLLILYRFLNWLMSCMKRLVVHVSKCVRFDVASVGHRSMLGRLCCLTQIWVKTVLCNGQVQAADSLASVSLRIPRLSRAGGLLPSVYGICYAN